MAEEKNERLTRELTVSVDLKALKDSVTQSLGKYGKIEAVNVKKPASLSTKAGDWSISVVYEKKEDFAKARSQSILHIPTSLQVEATPVKSFSLHFPYIWLAEAPDADFRPSGAAWEDIKKEITRVFAQKVPGSRVHLVNYQKTGHVIVGYDSPANRQKAIEIFMVTPWSIGGKQIPALQAGFPKAYLKRKAEALEQSSQPSAKSASTSTPTPAPLPKPAYPPPPVRK